MTCEYFIKEKNTYVVTATSVDPDGTAVIYIQKEVFANDPSDPTYSHIGFEIRELSETSSSLVDSQDVWNYEEILPSLHSDIIYIQRDGISMEFSLIQERLMKTESATFITETSQVNQDNINISM